MSLKRGYLFLGLVAITLFLGSCGVINSNMMFKTPKDGSFHYDSIPMRPTEDYTISVDDKLTFSLHPNSGRALIEGLTGTNTYDVNLNSRGAMVGQSGIFVDYVVTSEGIVDFPIIGEIKMLGLTVEQCVDTLEVLFSQQYQKPYVQVKITNRRCIVFSGNGNDASIVPLVNNNTSLLEVIAMTGGISPRGKASIVKVMRKVNGIREIYLIDISTIEGLKYADMIIQGNDYIYIEPKPQLIIGGLAAAAPVTSLISSIALIYTVLTKFK
jgi:polysaccharide biosynthesis/export protein